MQIVLKKIVHNDYVFLKTVQSREKVRHETESSATTMRTVGLIICKIVDTGSTLNYTHSMPSERIQKAVEDKEMRVDRGCND